MSMLTKAAVTTILPVKDMARARDFYQNKLGLEPKGFAADGNYLFACGGDAPDRADHQARRHARPSTRH